MKQLFFYVLINVFILTITACNVGPAKKNTNDSLAIVETNGGLADINYSGNYVTAGYKDRSKGYDWVNVNVDVIGKDKIRISIRSRSDLKRPSCTLDGEADQIGQGVFEAKLSNGTALFTFKGKELTISPKSEQDVAALYFYCSGGATLAGIYSKNEEKMDTIR